MKFASPRRTHFAYALAFALSLIHISGCGTPSYDAIPSASSARAGLEHALDTWKSGGKSEALGTSLQMVDSTWQAGRKLESYTIVSDEKSDTDQRFRVKLTFATPAKEEETRYVVIGKDPLWIYREDDYARMINMDNNPSDKTGRGRRTR